MRKTLQMITPLVLAVIALFALVPAGDRYDDKDFMGALCWFALSLCVEGIGALIYLAASALPPQD